MTRSVLVAVISLAAACGGVAGTAYPTTPIADPIPMNEARAQPATPVVTAVVSEPDPEPVEPEPEPEPAEPTPAVAHDHHPVAKDPPVKPKKKPRAVAPIRFDIV